MHVWLSNDPVSGAASCCYYDARQLHALLPLLLLKLSSPSLHLPTTSPPAQ
jgi:hypothetical protein